MSRESSKNVAAGYSSEDTKYNQPDEKEKL